MLDEKLADKYYRERLYSESNKPDYTPEELKGQEKIRKYFDEYSAVKDENERRLIVKKCYDDLWAN
ncbi:hypothetical protein AYP76_05955 [Ligilactobacillus agilis]|uniref:Uncharacterized protein n=1 Tax=Ligilactobacillus agilis TaxID=1601 RepID=A0A231Q711_9LACO|nr:LYR motif-containing protein [Ligilactobacillus agilis]OXC06789.1 hypothetical protein AYP74_01370 [Ligilactobacillus agilis]OXC08490.1 hypothetical protein AYP76_05955 [Ligilactobacillus agilis]OXC11461.1 hypothetical protein AYP75_04160 [Ligilactobacillus agilis]OXS41526.1 hypothetical protein AYP69_02520 [Ligilactobacillus agilis]OXS42707.1 hypothetical protein AYP70_01975 [Ligilactobacillus agilis]